MKTSNPNPLYRVASLIYDSLIVIALVISVSALAITINQGDVLESPVGKAINAVAYVLVVGLYFVGSWIRSGQTIGMRAWKIKVLKNNDDVTLDWGQAIARLLLGTVCLALAGIPILMAFFKPNRQPFYEQLTGSELYRVSQ